MRARLGRRAPAVLYVTYDGILEPLGYSQVFQYLRRLAPDYRIVLLSYEKGVDWADRARRDRLQREIDEAGLRWVPLRYHQRPTAPATAYDLAVGLATASYLVARERIGLVHARSYVPAVLALALQRLFGTRFLFDMRGFWADERVEGGLWPAGSRLYRVAKWFERQFLLSADAVVSLTRAGAETLQRFPYLQGRPPRVEVIPTCADLERFRPAAARRPRDDHFTLGYVGSASLWYQFDPVLEAFAVLRTTRPTARLLILNQGQHDYIRQRLAAFDVPARAVELKAVDYAAVPLEMQRMDAGVFFIRPTFSKQASAPTKLGEFLGCGIPCLTNAGVGDVEAILEGEAVGVAVSGTAPAAIAAGVRRLEELTRQADIRERCRAVAERHFDLEGGAAAYHALYGQLLGQLDRPSSIRPARAATRPPASQEEDQPAMLS